HGCEHFPRRRRERLGETTSRIGNGIQDRDAVAPCREQATDRRPCRTPADDDCVERHRTCYRVSRSREVVSAMTAYAVAVSLMTLPGAVAVSRCLFSDEADHFPVAAS